MKSLMTPIVTVLAAFGRSCYVANVGQEEPWGLTIDDYKGVADGPIYRNSRTRAFAAFALSLMLLLWLTGIAGLGRYSAACWPAFLPIGASFARRPIALCAVITVLAMLQCLMLYLFVHLYPIL